MKPYGLPYKGSKNLLAKRIVAALPPAEVLIDIFAGGCAVTHASLLSGKYRRIVANDITDMPRLFMEAIGGKYHNERRWISRDDFFHLKATDPYVRTCWSFGNDNLTYIYGRKVEPYKRALHYAVVFGQWEQFQELCPEVCAAARAALQGIASTRGRRVMIGRAIVAWLKEHGTPTMIAANPIYRSVKRRKKGDGQRLESLQRLERLQSLERLERLQSLTASQKDYRDVELPPGAIIYADPPYKGTGGYNGEPFDHEAFYDWAAAQPLPVFISEYAMPTDRFECVAQFPHLSRLAARGG